MTRPNAAQKAFVIKTPFSEDTQERHVNQACSVCGNRPTWWVVERRYFCPDHRQDAMNAAAQSSRILLEDSEQMSRDIRERFRPRHPLPPGWRR